VLGYLRIGSCKDKIVVCTDTVCKLLQRSDPIATKRGQRLAMLGHPDWEEGKELSRQSFILSTCIMNEQGII
jgi:hypothetical protein